MNGYTAETWHDLDTEVRRIAEGYVLTKPVTIESDDDLENIVQLLGDVKRAMVEVDATKTTELGPLKAMYTKFQSIFDDKLKALRQSEVYLKQGIADYRKKKDEARQREEAKLRMERDKAETRAATLRASGHDAGADFLDEMARGIITTVPQEEKIDGVHTRANWKAEVTDMAALIQAVAAGTVAPSVLQVNATALNQLAKATKGTITIPGVRVYNDEVIVART